MHGQGGGGEVARELGWCNCAFIGRGDCLCVRWSAAGREEGQMRGTSCSMHLFRTIGGRVALASGWL